MKIGLSCSVGQISIHIVSDECQRLSNFGFLASRGVCCQPRTAEQWTTFSKFRRLFFNSVELVTGRAYHCLFVLVVQRRGPISKSDEAGVG
jgi:hypothetical protein